MFSASTYIERRRQLIASLDRGLILLPGNGFSPINYADNYYPFRQDSSFLYYLGLNQPDLCAVIDVEAGRTTLFGDDATLDLMVWTGRQAPLSEQAEQVGISHVATTATLPGVLTEARRQNRPIHFLPPYRGKTILQLQAWLNLAPADPAFAGSTALIQAVIAQRSVKSAEEVAELHEAARVTNRMHLAAMQGARPGMKEREVAALVRQAAGEAGAEPAFPIIATVHGEVLHNHHYHHELSEGLLFLCDAGGHSPQHYAGDMTRTFPVADTFTPRQRDCYQLVLDAQQAAIEGLRPGVPYRDLHLKAATVLAQGLIDMGLMQGSAEAAVAAGAHALFFPHGLGHMMGLDVHDMEGLGEDKVGYTAEIQRSQQFGLSALRLGRELEPGFVLTVEPGLYFVPLLIERWEAQGYCREFLRYDRIAAFKDFGGIRIEDDFVITETGAELLGDPLPKTVAEVESIRREALA
jgi:Xaa-Pro aminopeptidase